MWRAMSYEVRTPVFEGPFDLLLHLILREDVDLYEVKLADIVDAYLVELERLDRCDLAMATEFLLIAATLVELKARRLLPDDDRIDLDEEFSLWEERDLLLSRLIECKTFKDAAASLRRLEHEASRSFPRVAGLDERYLGLTPDLLVSITPDQLRKAYLKAVTPKPVPRIDLIHVAPIRVSVADAVQELLEDLPQMGRVSFRRLTEGLTDRLEVVVHFLAILELFKQGLVDLAQTERFGDIDVRWIGGHDAGATHRYRADQVDDYEG